MLLIRSNNIPLLGKAKVHRNFLTRKITPSQVKLIAPFMFYYSSLRLQVFDAARALKFFRTSHFRYLTIPQRVKNITFVN
jgi:hypothetical protein